ncbi:unnamed protein product [Owenia fusiformis]|uniref:Uncharacterized protein n=1 Tax=Owenia fusiformis TaxID=6347 RepID=A0A8J1TWU7_OWEFU|nr:unnamed protein product [Owenia fusiformis]
MTSLCDIRKELIYGNLNFRKKISSHFFIKTDGFTLIMTTITNNYRLYKLLGRLSRCCIQTQSRNVTNSTARKKRVDIFNKEKERQLSLIRRIEKIQVEHKGPPEDCTLIMNKDLSTPFNCAMHIQELLMNRSVLALVNGKPWDMHRPLVEDCELTFLHEKDEDPYLVNQAIWRSGSFILGHILETAFKDQHYVELCCFPPPSVKSGSFIYDVDLKMPNWKPTKMELNVLSRLGGRLQYEDLRFERLEVDASIAQKMFEDNRFKKVQVEQIAAKSDSGSSITLYRMGDHIDMTGGPLISHTGQINRFAVTGIHEIESPDYGALQRVQGIIIPANLSIHYWTFEWLAERAAQFNAAGIPTKTGYNTYKANKEDKIHEDLDLGG